MQSPLKKKYQRAKIKEKKIKVSYFLTPMGFLDEFNLLGTVYAQSGGGSTSNTSSSSTGGAGTGSSTGGTSGTNSGTGGN